MAVTAEQQKTNLENFYPDIYLVPEIPKAERIDLLPIDELSRKRAERFIGQVALNNVYIEPTENEAPNTTLLKAIERAKNGDLQAYSSVETNVRIAVAEALIKSGHISTVEMEINENGYWMQFGQSMMHVHANALKTEKTYIHPGLVDRTKAETVNGQRIEDLGRFGEMDDHYIFVASLVPSTNEVPIDISTKKAGFFGETMTAALQLTSIENGEGKVETAFVAGVSDQNKSRFDLEVMCKIYELAGYDVSNWQPIDFLKTPLKIHKSNLPNGVADIVELYDQIASEVTNEKLFFGQAVQAKEYCNFAEKSKIREQGLKSITNEIVQNLIGNHNKLTTPDDAINELAELIRLKTVSYAVKDTSINPNVFGPVAAKYLSEARMYHQQGQYTMMAQKLNSAIDNAIISVCGGTSGKNKDIFGIETDEFESLNDSDEDCEFISKECPQCGTKNVKTVVTKHKISGDCGCEVIKKK